MTYFCSNCGSSGAVVPTVCALNLKHGSHENYKLRLPPMCDRCLADKGIARFNLLVPKTDKLASASEMLDTHKSKIEDWTAKSLRRTAEELTNMGMPGTAAKEMLGLD